MPAFQPTADQFRAFRDDPHDGPIAQVNLLKFRVKANYGPDEPEHGSNEDGATAYGRYVAPPPRSRASLPGTSDHPTRSKLVAVCGCSPGIAPVRLGRKQ